MIHSQARGGCLFMLVGPAGAGKNTVMKAVLELLPDVRQFPTVTTRSKRTGEREGREHFFVSHERFAQMDANGELLERANVHGEMYGMPRRPLEEALAAGEMLVADVDMLGASEARKAFPHNVILVFIAPPSLTVLAARMRERGESEGQIGKRLLRAPSEMAFAPQCDYLIVNETIAQASADLANIIRDQGTGRAAQAPTPVHINQPNIAFSARVLLIQSGRALVDAAQQMPEQMFSVNTPPHEAALNAAAFIYPAEARALSTYEDAQNSYIPPVYVQDESVAGCDHFVYLYVLRLGSGETPAGWHWAALADLALPLAVLDRLRDPVAG